MNFEKNKYYIVECINIKTFLFQRWHLLFVPNHKAYKIINDEIYLHNLFRDVYYITNIIDVTANIKLDSDNITASFTIPQSKSILKKTTSTESKTPNKTINTTSDFITKFLDNLKLERSIAEELPYFIEEIESEYSYNNYEIDYYKECPQCCSPIYNYRCETCGFDWESYNDD